MANESLPPIDFRALNEALLGRIKQLVQAWLPGGEFRGHEYACGSISGGKGSSFSVCVQGERIGRWGEFAGDDRGGDLISLYAAIHGLSHGKAALEVARAEGLESVANIVKGAPPGAPPPPPRPPAPPPPPAADDDRERWVPVMPVPPDAPRPTFNHWHRRHADIVHTAAYKVDGQLLGFVVRFRTSDGGKDTLPYTWCVSERDGGAKWHWKTWAFPRPLYYPGGAHPKGRTVVLVEGEIKAEVLQALLDAGAPGVYCVVSWPGGSKAWKQALWEWLKGSTVLLWPDCDSKRENLTTKERQACNGDEVAIAAAQSTKPYLAREKQPGMAAMLGIGTLLRDTRECKVSMLPCEAPGIRPDGWDARDAIEVDGWDFARVLEFFGQASALVDAPAEPPAADKPAKARKPKQGGSEATDDSPVDSGLPWWLEMFRNPHTGLIAMSRKTVITALRNDDELKDCLGFNLLSGEVSAVQPWPWREQAGPVGDTDDLRLGDWISVKYKVPGAGRAALTEAIHTVADERPYHPVKQYLEGLQHDGKPRSRKWLMHACQIDPETLTPQRRAYLELVSEFWLIGMVARIFEPGCKFDYSLVLEGLTGRRKSTFLQAMAGAPYYSDTHFDIGGNKDGFDQLQGLWLYELSEMSALRKADSESVKAFFSSQSDRYRASYGRYVQNHPRQCVIGCSTNKRQYLYDTTGNRRFWPLWIDMPIRIEWFMKWRDQLFAEAVALYRSGARFAPTLDEEQRLFVPEQELRLVETGVQSELMRLLTRQGSKEDGGSGSSSQLTENTNFVTIGQLVRALGTDVGKSTTMLESQIRAWLEAQGWKYARLGKALENGVRPWGYKRPEGWPAPSPEDEGADDGPPGPHVGDSGHAQAANHEGDDDLPI